MLYILAGETESGKTTWICDFVKFLEKQNIAVAGVVAPGKWEKDVNNDNKVTKVAIDNVLLPSHTTIQIATRKLEYHGDDDGSVAKKGGDWSPGIEPNTNKKIYVPIKWNFDYLAFEKVNDFFEELKQNVQLADRQNNEQTTTNFNKQTVLIIDELGPKELEFNEGLNHAVELLLQGPNSIFKDAIVVVRKHLVEAARAKFIEWGKPVMINTNTCFGSMLEKLK